MNYQSNKYNTCESELSVVLIDCLKPRSGGSVYRNQLLS